LPTALALTAARGNLSIAAKSRPKKQNLPRDFAGKTTDMATLLPYIGGEFLERLDDGREGWMYGERIKNIAATRPFAIRRGSWRGFTNALHCDHAGKRNAISCLTEWGGYTSNTSSGGVPGAWRCTGYGAPGCFLASSPEAQA
jgi:hypothetical protein